MKRVNIDFKFEIGDKVYYPEGGEAKEGTIESCEVEMTLTEKLEYRINYKVRPAEDNAISRIHNEAVLFETKQECEDLMTSRIVKTVMKKVNNNHYLIKSIADKLYSCVEE